MTHACGLMFLCFRVEVPLSLFICSLLFVGRLPTLSFLSFFLFCPLALRCGYEVAHLQCFTRFFIQNSRLHMSYQKKRLRFDGNCEIINKTLVLYHACFFISPGDGRPPDDSIHVSPKWPGVFKSLQSCMWNRNFSPQFRGVPVGIEL